MYLFGYFQLTLASMLATSNVSVSELANNVNPKPANVDRAVA